MIWVIEVNIQREQAAQWVAVHPAHGKPYRYTSDQEAARILRLCYPDCTQEQARVRAVTEQDYTLL